jgi:hypothetical protein
MTERNSVFRANKAMFANKTFVPSALQVAKATLQAIFDTISCAFKVSDMSFTFKGTVNIPESGNYTGLKAHLLVYDFVKGVSCFAFSQNVVPTNNVFTLNVTHWSPEDFNTTTGSQLADCRFYLFLSGLDRNDKKVISSTFSVLVTV